MVNNDRKKLYASIPWHKCFFSFLLVLTTITFQGCGDKYEDSCVWHSDTNIKECGYRSFKNCVNNCTYCITRKGVDDDCNQLMCAATCAKREGEESDCLVNFKNLCDLAKPHVPSCEVDCSFAMPSVSPNSIKLIALGLFAWYASSTRTLLLGLLIFTAITFQGCGCPKPEKQLDWEPSDSNLRQRAQMYDEDGLWRGSPTWTFTPELELESYTCKTREPEGYCSVWTGKEWNCHEEDFGVCKCVKSSSNRKYCEEWTCHSLEADQHVCSLNEENEESCTYDPFPMNEATYLGMLNERVRAGQQAERSSDWYTKTSVVNKETDWPPIGSSLQERKLFWWFEICIVNGDSIVAKHLCNSVYREVETELSHCKCTQSNTEETMCETWTCEERDTGQFTILWRTSADISEWVEGIEYEEYKCISSYKNEALGTSQCIQWEGTIGSIEEVEATRCMCSDKTSCAHWLCDEYELPVTPQWNHPLGVGYFIGFIAAYGMLVIFGANTKVDQMGGRYRYIMGCWTLLFILMLPFCVITIGLWGWMVISFPFYAFFGAIIAYKKWSSAREDSYGWSSA